MKDAAPASSYSADTRQPVAALRASLNFIDLQSVLTKPETLTPDVTGGDFKFSFDFEAHVVPISDMREIAGALSVDRGGFELLKHTTAVSDLYDDDAVEQTYKSEIEALLRRKFGASRVVIFDVKRRSDGESGVQNPEGLGGSARQAGVNSGLADFGTARRAHVDYTTKSGPQKPKDILGEDEAERLAESGARIMQFNVWQPIRGPVERSPLAIADASSVAPEDLIATDNVFPHRVGEIFHLAHAPSQRWYYAPHMTPDELLLFKGWDSLDDGRARFTPHTSFNSPETRDDAPPRESIELRTLVIVE
jgi:hypothetical protein